MKRILLEIEYKGKNYAGWQAQDKKKTIQGEIEKVLSNFLKEDIKIFSSGRTDAGVHAKSQFAHFDTNSKFDFSRLIRPINDMLSGDIAIKSVKEVDSSFHARYSVMQKTYHYSCYVSETRRPLKDDFFMRLNKMPNIELMQSALKKFLGVKDFTSFCTKKKDEKEINNIREIFDFTLQANESELLFSITGSGFLHNMVRIIIGTVLSVGEGRLKVEDIDKIFELKNRIYAPKMADAEGLVLFEVKYN